MKTKEEINKIKEQAENRIKYSKKICWEAEYEDGEFCIGENTVREIINEVLEQLGY